MADHPQSIPDHDVHEFVHDTERLDQHFLDPGTATRIVATAHPSPDDVVLEIGAGAGVLTAAILAASPAQLIAVEVDHRWKPYLATLERSHAELSVIMGRIQDITSQSLNATTVIIANPPFSALEAITRLIRALPDMRAATLCVSRRWAKAVAAPLGTPAYGTPSVAIQSRFHTHLVGTVDGRRFTPAVRQPAAILQLTRRSDPDHGLDVLADALLHRGGLRVKDFLRSARLRRTPVGADHRTLLHMRALQEMQQRRLTNLTSTHITDLAAALRSCA